MKITDKYVFFWREYFSNWAFTENGLKIEVNGNEAEVPTSEHLFMLFKAQFFDDEDSVQKILTAPTPKDAKAIGRRVRNFNSEKWDRISDTEMSRALAIRYEQDSKFAKMLTDNKYRGKTFVEASPYDTIWGIGLDENDPDIENPDKWQGQNKLGKCLTALRDKVLSGNTGKPYRENHSNKGDETMGEFKKNGPRAPQFLPSDPVKALQQLCNTPQHKNKVEEEKQYFLLYLNYAVNNLQRLVSDDRFDTGMKDEKGKQKTAEVLPENLFEIDDKIIEGKKKTGIRSRLTKADDATILKLANFLWLFNVDEPGRDFKDFRKLTIMLVTRIYALRNLFAHLDKENGDPLLADHELYVLMEGIFKSAANDNAMSEGVRMDKLYKLKLLNKHTELKASDPGYDKAKAYEFTRKGIIFLTCLALYKDEAHEFCQLFVDMRLPVYCPKWQEKCAELDECNASEKTCNAAKAKALIAMFTYFSCRRGRTVLNGQTQDYMCFSDIVAYLNKVPAAAYDYSERMVAEGKTDPLAADRTKLAALAAESTESEKKKHSKYDLQRRFRERFLSFAAGYCEDFGLIPSLRFKRLDVSQQLGRKRYCFGPERNGELQVRMDRHFAIAQDAIGFEYLPETHYGVIKIRSLRGTVSENELKHLLYLCGKIDVNKAVDTYFGAYHRMLEKMLNLPEGKEFRWEDFETDLCTIAGVTPEKLYEDPWDVLKPYVPANLLRFFYDDDMQLTQEELRKHLCYRLKVMIRQADDCLNRLRCFNQWRETDKETRSKCPPDCSVKEINFSNHSGRMQDSELIRWVFNYINLFLNPEDKFRQLPRGEQHHQGTRDCEYQLLHAAIGKYSLDQKGFPSLLHKLRPDCPLTAASDKGEKKFVRLDGAFAEQLNRLEDAGRKKLKDNPRYDANGKPVRFTRTLFMLAEAAATCYKDFCREELRKWERRDAYSVEIDELRAICRRFGVRPGMPLDRESLIKTILKVDVDKWRHAFDYSTGKPYGGRNLSSMEHIVPQVGLPSGFGQRLISGDCPKPLRGFFREDGVFDFNRAMRATLTSPVALRGYYDTTLLISEMKAIAAAGGKTAQKSALDKAARTIAKADCQDLLLRDIAFKYRDRAFKNEQALSYTVKHDKGGSIYEYFSTEDTMKIGKFTIRFLPNDVTRPAFSTVMDKDVVEALIRANNLTDTEFDFYRLMEALKILQASDRNKRLELLPYLAKFEERGKTGGLDYEGKTSEEKRAMEYPCYRKAFPALTEADYNKIADMRNQVFHNGLALDTAPVIALLKKYLPRR